MNSTNKNIPNYKSNSRGGKRGGRGGLNGSNNKTDPKAETVSTPSKPNTSPQSDQKEPEVNVNQKISTNNTSTSTPSQVISSPQVQKTTTTKSKKAKIDFENLPDLTSSAQKNLDASVNESKGDINPDTSLISEDNRAANNDNDKSLLSVENFEVSNKQKNDAGNSRKQSANVDVNIMSNTNSGSINAEKTIDISMNDEINLNRTSHEEPKDTDVADTEAKDGDEKGNLENKINDVKIDIQVSVENVAKPNEEDEKGKGDINLKQLFHSNISLCFISTSLIKKLKRLN